MVVFQNIKGSRKYQRTLLLIIIFILMTIFTFWNGAETSSITQNNTDDKSTFTPLNTIPELCKPFFNPPNFLGHSKPSKPVTLTPVETRFPTREDGEPIPDILHFISYNKLLQTNRYMCSIESVLRHNPNHILNIYVPSPVDFKNSIDAWKDTLIANIGVKKGLAYTNRIRIVQIDYPGTFKDTPLEPWYTDKKHEKSWWVQQNLGNAFRLALLWKYGGTYLDLDIISVNSLHVLGETGSVGHEEAKKKMGYWERVMGDGYYRAPLGRLIAREESEQLNNAALRFPPKDLWIDAIMNDFVDKFDGYTWANNGPFCITRTWKSKCADHISHEKQIDTPKNPFCHNLIVLEVSRLYPIHFRATHHLTNHFSQECQMMNQIKESSFGVHWWHKGFENEKKMMSKNSMLGKLFETQCPNVVKTFGWSGLSFA